MATGYSPQIATDGLVFYYDTGNGKSYKGVPTTNIAPYISTHGTSDFTLPSLPDGVTTIHSKGAIINGTTDWADIFQTSGYSIQNGERLVVSAWVYIPADKVNNRFNINADINGNNTGLASWHDLPAGQWHKLRGSWLNNTGATANATYTRLEPWTPAEWTGGTNTAYAINFMVESGPFGSDYKGSQALPANTTRSATEGLKDLTKNSTIDLTNVSFDSNAQIEFDGTNDYILTGIDTPTNPLTVSIWFNQHSVQGRAHLLGNYQSGILKGANFSTESRRILWYMYGPSVYGFGNTGISGTDYNLNEWNNVVYWNNGLEYRIYLNGELKASIEDSGWAQVPDLSIGGSHDYFNDFFDGKIDSVKLYNRALTASEIKANYNAIKGRFGI